MTALTGVVAGWDGSPQAEAAVEWAAHEADRRGLPLAVLFAAGLTGTLPGPVTPSLWLTEAAVEEARGVADRGVGIARRAVPGLDVRATLDSGLAARALVAASRTAALVVVGSRGRGEVMSDLLGSVATDVSAHARCPVVVLRGDAARRPGPERPVVVGVDGSPESDAAVAWAGEVAAAHSAELQVVCAWRPPGTAGWEVQHYVDAFPGIPPGAAARQAAEQAAEAAAKRARRDRPGLAVTSHAVDGPPGRAVSDAAADAGLLVVGSRGHGGFTGLLLGSVARAAVHRSPCPVVVVHPAGDRPGDSQSPSNGQVLETAGG